MRREDRLFTALPLTSRRGSERAEDSTGTTRQRLPVDPVDGQVIDLFCALGGTINIHTGYDRPFHASSTGLSGSHQCNLNNLGVQIFRVVYIEGEDEWLLI